MKLNEAAKKTNMKKDFRTVLAAWDRFTEVYDDEIESDRVYLKRVNDLTRRLEHFEYEIN